MQTKKMILQKLSQLDGDNENNSQYVLNLSIRNGFYTGDIQDGKRHGYGLFTNTNGNKYEGEFKDNMFNGKGVFTYADGNVYDGEFKDDMFNGKGVFTFTNGNKYDGEFKDDMFNGKGVFTYANGDLYDGEFKDDMFNGKGVLTYADGDVYDGNFVNGKHHGQGVYTFADGNKYDGSFVDDKRHGPGVFTFTNGKIYKGEFIDDYFFITANKPKKQNNCDTLMLIEESINNKSRSTSYYKDKFLPGGMDVDVKVVKDCQDVLKQLEEYLSAKKKQNREKLQTLRLVILQHGSKCGGNDLNIDKETAKKMLKMIAEICDGNLIISDQGCCGPMKHYFTDELLTTYVANGSFKNTAIRSAPDDRICAVAMKFDGAKFRHSMVTLGRDGSAKSREYKSFSKQKDGKVAMNIG